MSPLDRHALLSPFPPFFEAVIFCTIPKDIYNSQELDYIEFDQNWKLIRQ